VDLLFVSIAFPPKRDPECIQAGRYFYYLSSNKAINIDVVTSKSPTLFMPIDENLNKFDSGWRTKIEVPIYENKYSNFLLRKIVPGGIDYPDSKWSFHKQWRKVIKSLPSKPDIIYSRSFPISSNLMAYNLKQFFNVPWVMHLSDPWYYSPVHNFNSWHKLWEKKCFEAAAIICLTSEESVDLYKSIYPQFAHKLQYFPNVYDDADLGDNPIKTSSKLKITYTGGLVGERSIKWLLPLFDLLEKEISDISNKIEFIFAGDMDKSNAQLFNKMDFSFVKHVGAISMEKAMSLQKNSHILLLIDNPVVDKSKNVFFPSKLLDYFVARRKILSITSKHSTSYEVLQDRNACIFTHTDSQKVYEFICEALEKFSKKEWSYFNSDLPSKEFSANANSERLVKLLKDIISDFEK